MMIRQANFVLTFCGVNVGINCISYGITGDAA